MVGGALWFGRTGLQSVLGELGKARTWAVGVLGGVALYGIFWIAFHICCWKWTRWLCIGVYGSELLSSGERYIGRWISWVDFHYLHRRIKQVFWHSKRHF